jgi:hypothetical protein
MNVMVHDGMRKEMLLESDREGERNLRCTDVIRLGPREAIVCYRGALWF